MGPTQVTPDLDEVEALVAQARNGTPFERARLLGPLLEVMPALIADARTLRHAVTAGLV